MAVFFWKHCIIVKDKNQNKATPNAFLLKVNRQKVQGGLDWNCYLNSENCFFTSFLCSVLLSLQFLNQNTKVFQMVTAFYEATTACVAVTFIVWCHGLSQPRTYGFTQHFVEKIKTKSKKKP